jgi:hypothetical protein
MPAKDVDITLQNGTPHANPETVTVSRGKGESVLWHNNSNRDIIIKFDKDSPFGAKPHPYHLKPGEKKVSGGIIADADTTWNYTIKVEAGAAADPQVIIKS